LVQIQLGWTNKGTAAAVAAFHTVIFYKVFTVKPFRIFKKFLRYNPAGTGVDTPSTADTGTDFILDALSLAYPNRAEEVLVTGISREYKACPIIGPPEMIFSGSLVNPPAASINSR